MCTMMYQILSSCSCFYIVLKNCVICYCFPFLSGTVPKKVITAYVNVWSYKNWDSHFHLANCTCQELWIFYMFSVDMRFMPVWKCESIFFQITKFGLSSSLYLLFPHDGMELNNFTLKMKKYAKSYLGQNFWKARSSLSSIQ